MKIKKILLLAPPALTFKSGRDINPLPPMGLGYLAAVAEGLDLEVEILDSVMLGWDHEEEVDDTLIRVGLSDREIKDCLAAVNPDLVGINCQFSRQYKIYHRMFSLVKQVNPRCLTLAGGAHATVCPEEVLSDTCCDYLLMGEAEDSFQDLLLKLSRGENLTTVDGLGWKANGTLSFNPKTRWIADLDSLPRPAYRLMKLEKYFGLKASHGLRHQEKFCPIITSRGCPARCTFCSARKVWGDRYRFRSVDNVITEMRFLREQYGVEELMFEDDNLTANPRRASRLFTRMIEEGFNFSWDTPNGIGVWSIDETMIDLMQRSGCVNLNFPVESGSQAVLDRIIKKPLKLDKVRQLMAYCRKIGLKYNMFLVIGMPGETLGDIWKSFRFAADCGCYTPHISVATPYPGTELYQQCLEHGYLAREYRLDDLFIKSFMIRTTDWSERDLQKTLFWGKLYLLARRARARPLEFLREAIDQLRDPYQFLERVKNLGKSC